MPFDNESFADITDADLWQFWYVDTPTNSCIYTRIRSLPSTWQILTFLYNKIKLYSFVCEPNDQCIRTPDGELWIWQDSVDECTCFESACPTDYLYKSSLLFKTFNNSSYFLLEFEISFGFWLLVWTEENEVNGVPFNEADRWSSLRSRLRAVTISGFVSMNLKNYYARLGVWGEEDLLQDK